MKTKIREITARKKPNPMEYRIQHLNLYLVGWCGYFALADTKSIFESLEGWIRGRLRMCLWKDWKNPQTKVRNLIRLGILDWQANEWGNTRKSYWRISKSPILYRTLGNSYWSNQGLKSLQARYEILRYFVSFENPLYARGSKELLAMDKKKPQPYNEFRSGQPTSYERGSKWIIKV